jgi:hypothetical protein
MFQTWIRNVPEQFYSRQPMFQAKKMFQTWIRNVPEQFHSRQPMFHAKNENVSIFFVMHVDIINAKCFSFFSSPNSCCSSCFHMFQRQIINVFRINVLESMCQYFFFCSHRHDCGLYTMLYIESWNGKNTETALQPVIAATY